MPSYEYGKFCLNTQQATFSLVNTFRPNNPQLFCPRPQPLYPTNPQPEEKPIVLKKDRNIFTKQHALIDKSIYTKHKQCVQNLFLKIKFSSDEFPKVKRFTSDFGHTVKALI